MDWNFGFSTGNTCFNSFKDIDRSDFKVVVAESWNFGDLVKGCTGSELNSKEESKLRSYYYEFFLTRIGAAPFRGSGTSIKKKATDTGNDGMLIEFMVAALDRVLIDYSAS